MTKDSSRYCIYRWWMVLRTGSLNSPVKSCDGTTLVIGRCYLSRYPPCSTYGPSGSNSSTKRNAYQINVVFLHRRRYSSRLTQTPNPDRSIQLQSRHLFVQPTQKQGSTSWRPRCVELNSLTTTSSSSGRNDPQSASKEKQEDRNPKPWKLRSQTTTSRSSGCTEPQSAYKRNEIPSHTENFPRKLWSSRDIKIVVRGSEVTAVSIPWMFQYDHFIGEG